MSLAGTMLQNKAAKKAAGRQMAFQREMASTRYQRTMADMKSAGLNPMLAYKQGGGGVPGGASYTPANIGAAAALGASQGTSSAVAAARAAQERRNLAKQEALLTSQQQLVDTQGSLTVQRNRQLDGDVARSQLDRQIWSSPAGRRIRMWQQINQGGTVGTVVNSAKALKGVLRGPAKGLGTSRGYFNN